LAVSTTILSIIIYVGTFMGWAHRDDDQRVKYRRMMRQRTKPASSPAIADGRTAASKVRAANKAILDTFGDQRYHVISIDGDGKVYISYKSNSIRHPIQVSDGPTFGVNPESVAGNKNQSVPLVGQEKCLEKCLALYLHASEIRKNTSLDTQHKWVYTAIVRDQRPRYPAFCRRKSDTAEKKNEANLAARQPSTYDGSGKRQSYHLVRVWAKRSAVVAHDLVRDHWAYLILLINLIVLLYFVYSSLSHHWMRYSEPYAALMDLNYLRHILAAILRRYVLFCMW